MIQLRKKSLFGKECKTLNSDYSRPRKRAGRHEKGAGRKKRFKSLLNGKIVDWSKFKAFANGKLNVVRIMISVSDRVENIVGKGENAGSQHFLLFPQCSQKASFSGRSKSELCGKELNKYYCQTKAKIFNPLSN